MKKMTGSGPNTRCSLAKTEKAGMYSTATNKRKFGRRRGRIVHVKIGVISDTHNFLDPQVLTIFKGVDHILHGGDIGHSTLIKELEKIAPVTAVLGNCDSGIPFRVTEVLMLGGRKFLVHHIVNVRALERGLQAKIENEQPDVVVFGHTHKPFQEVIGKTLFFNPGYAGKQRFKLERSVAVLHCTSAAVRVKYHKL